MDTQKIVHPNCEACPRCGHETVPKIANDSIADAAACQHCHHVVERTKEIDASDKL